MRVYPSIQKLGFHHQVHQLPQTKKGLKSHRSIVLLWLVHDLVFEVQTEADLALGSQASHRLAYWKGVQALKSSQHGAPLWKLIPPVVCLGFW